MVKESQSLANSCNCKGGSSAKKDKEGSKKTSGFNRAPCQKQSSKDNKSKGCHESYEKFKQPKTIGEGNGKDDGKCHSTSADLSNGSSKDDAGRCNREENDCSNAYEKFLKSRRDAECSDSDEMAKPECQPHGEETRNSPCAGSVDRMQETREPDCLEQNSLNDSASQCEPIACCNGRAKEDLQQHKAKSGCSNVNESLREQITKSVSTAPPCPPKLEESKEQQSGSACTKKAAITCPQTTKLSWSEFFPMDIRNKKLHECIEKFNKIDPNQVVSKCSQFATSTMDNSEKCLKQMQKTQQRCVQGMKDSSAAMKKTTARIGLPKNYRTLMNRWAPSAGAYLATSAIAAIYVTEWKAVLKYVPVWKDVVLEEGGPL